MFHAFRIRGTKRILIAPAAMVAGALLLTSCAGGAGQADAGSGFEYGADQEEVNSVLEELEPATITMQAGSASPNSHWAKAPEGFAAAVEERSNGKLSVDVVYGQPIAPFAEVDDALADGRIDIGLMIPQYDQATYPAFHAVASSLFGQPSSPVVGDAAHQGQVLDLAWDSEEVISDYEEQGLVPLIPSVNAGTYVLSCTQVADGEDDWKGRMVRVSGRYVETAIRAIGANPVSMDLTEVYEGLQRNAIDCTASQPLTTVDAGTLEVAPHLMLTPEESSFSTRAGAALMAGVGFQELPLAYQQIIFDSTRDYLAANMGLLVDARADAYGIVRDEGGSVQMLDEGTAQKIAADNDQQLGSLIEAPTLGDDWGERVSESGAEWRSTIEELGYSDDGTDEDLDSWYEIGSVDFGSAATQMFEETSLEHRPN